MMGVDFSDSSEVLGRAVDADVKVRVRFGCCELQLEPFLFVWRSSNTDEGLAQDSFSPWPYLLDSPTTWVQELS